MSSVQKELAEERRAVKDFILHDPLLSRFVEDVFLFEDLPVRGRRPDELYLSEVERCDVFIGILGNRYGWKNSEGKSPVELEFKRAAYAGCERMIFVKGVDDSCREPEMQALVRKIGEQVNRRRFTDIPGLISELYAGLVDLLERDGALRTTPFDDTPCDGATLADIDPHRVADFVATAESKGRLRLNGSREPQAVLQHFNLLRNGQPVNAAMLLFGCDPSRFFNNAQVHCFHFHGTEKRKPIASQQPYGGTLFEVIDQAVEFVLAKIDRRVGTRAASSQAPVEFEVPRSVITEAVVNAVTHRDYRSAGFVQVLLFADRIEVWNPGALPPGLTPELLREPHGPIPRNPLIAEPLFRVQYVEKAGTGTTDMISDCLDAGLPEPEFRQSGPHFVTTIWRDWLTENVLAGLDLNERQKKAVKYLKLHGKISNSECQAETGATKKTATRDLSDLKIKNIVEQVGSRGPGVYYVLQRKRDIMGTIETSGRSGAMKT
ncbi:MAG: ATP-binding protein [Lentisphaerota bacterium]